MYQSNESKGLTAQALWPNVTSSFDELFKFQFVLSKSRPETSDNWSHSQLGKWHLQTCPHLQKAPVHDADGGLVGWFLGVGIDELGEAVRDEFLLPERIGSAEFWVAVESRLAQFAGRFAVVIFDHADERFYFDGALDQSVVFNASEGLVASSVCLAAYGELQQNPIFDGTAILTSQMYYGFDHTSDIRVRRARPNHYLDLKHFTLHRHWPTADTTFDVHRSEREALIEKVHMRLKQTTIGLVRNFKCCLPISGGHDSRYLLSLVKDEPAGSFEPFTHATNHNSLVDTYVGSKVCEALGLPHTVIDTKGTDHEHMLNRADNGQRFWQFAYRTGLESGTRDPRAGLADVLSPKCDVLIRGNLLGLLAGQQYAKNVLGKPFDLTYALRRLRIAPDIQNAEILKWGPDYMDWVRTLPQSAEDRIYDLAFLELVQPHALGALLSGSVNSFYVNPFNDRFLLHSAMRFRPRQRRFGRIYKELQDRAAPELAAIPYTAKVRRRVVEKLGVSPPYSKLKELDPIRDM